MIYVTFSSQDRLVHHMSRGEQMKSRVLSFVAALLVALAVTFGNVVPAQAAYGNIYVTFGDWRCQATGGGTVVAVQMGSQYGSSPYTAGRTIRIGARTGTSNNLTGVIWCKRPWWTFRGTTPVYNISQGLWVSYVGQRFNV